MIQCNRRSALGGMSAALAMGFNHSICRGDTAPAISDEEFARLQKLLQPDPSELWRTIPWKISLLDGQRTSAELRKPIFIWAMDGHPLGCT